jgi:hypothetical protein
MFFRCYSKAIWPSTPPAINSTHAVWLLIIAGY